LPVGFAADAAWIKCPTLVLTGDQDNTIPNSLSKEMAEGIPARSW
jgi:pimeloyl-ACP methyl ester carboxylesterase